MADDKVIISVDLDNKNIDSTLKNTEKQIEKTGNKIESTLNNAFKVNGLADLTAGLFLAKESADAVISSIKKVGKALFDLSLEGEKIKSIERSFNLLSDQAGLSTASLRDDIIKAAGGFVDAKSAISASNEAIVKLGRNAEQLPQIFELAKQVSKVFGKDVIDAFDQISQAVASGNTRSIKQIGLIVDVDRVNKEYAKGLGTTVDLLTQEQKQQALLNAVLERGKTSFAGITLSNETLSGSYKTLKATTSEFGDTIATITSKVFGPFFTSLTKYASANIDELNLKLKDTSGIKINIDDQIKLLNIRIKENQDLIRGNIAPGLRDQLKQENIQYSEQIKLIKSRKEAQDEASLERAIKSSANLKPDNSIGTLTSEQIKAQNENNLKLQQQYQSESLAIKQQDLSNRIAIANQIQNEEFKNQELKRLQLEQEELLLGQSLLKQNEIRQKYNAEAGYVNGEANRLIELEEARHQAEIDKIRKDAADKQLAKIIQLRESMRNIVVSGLVSTITSVSNALIKGENAFKAFAGSVLNLFGDLAIQLGTFYIMQGIAKHALFSDITGGESIAAGASLIALGAVLKSFFGGAGAATNVGSGAGSAAVPGGAGDEQTQQDIEEKTTKVNINVEGTVLSPIEVGKQISQILEDTFSATGTKVVTA